MNNCSQHEFLKLAAMVDGKTVLIPNLLHLLPEGWYDEPQPEILERVDDDIDTWLKTYVVRYVIYSECSRLVIRRLDMDQVKLSCHREKGNYTLLAAYMYPRASQEKLVTTSKALYWTFLFDDG